MENQINIREDLIKYIESKYEIKESFACKFKHSHILCVSFLPENQEDLLKMKEDVNQAFGRNHKSTLYGNVFIEVELSDYSWKESCNKKEVLCTTQWR